MSILYSSAGSAARAGPEIREVIYHRGEFTLQGYLCRPEGPGPFPAVVYHHGGLGNQIGGAPRQTCEALSQSGFIGFSGFRRPTLSMEGHLEEALAGIDYVKRLDGVDLTRMGMIGFSRGGHLAFKAAARRRDIKALVIMAAAPGGEGPEKFLSEIQGVEAPVLLLVAANDRAPFDHVRLMHRAKAALESRGRPARLVVYPPYGRDGHRMFFEVGEYWDDVVSFLREHLE